MIRALAVVVVGFLASGCALTIDEIDVPYEGRANITVVEGADKVTVAVTNVDKRTVYKDRVGTKKNGYGMEMAKIVARNDIAKTFADAVEFELENLGFRIGEDGKLLTVALIRFYNDFKMGFFAGDAVADGLIVITITDANGEVSFSSSYEGGAIEPDIQLALGYNARIALIRAMADIVSKIAQDRNLHTALLK
jgi:uncharacterized lipoprotein|tara:strand:+ start:1020 stop:1601 length:582 start_codon:yes stop_codon:yes gene_type:complete